MGKVLVFIVFLFLSVSGFGEDFTKFLVQPDFEVVEENGLPVIFPGGHDEKYLARDSQGKEYKLRLKNPLPLLGEVGGSILQEMMGLPSIPVYPILARRGENGLPSVEVAKSLPVESEHHARVMGLAGSRGEIFPATLQEKVTIVSSFDYDSLSGKQFAELLGHLLVHGIIGNNDIQFSNKFAGNIVFTGEQFITVDATQAFKFYPDESGDKNLLGKFLNIGPRKYLSSLSVEKQQEVLKELDQYLSRLEGMTNEDFELLFSSYFNAAKNFRDFKNLPDFDYLGEILKRSKNARNQMISFLESCNFDDGLLDSYRKVRPGNKIEISIPKVILAMDDIPSVHEFKGKALLWSLYFQDFWKVRFNAIASWAKELNVSGDWNQVVGIIQEMEQENTSESLNATNKLETDLGKDSCSSNVFKLFSSIRF